MEDDVEKCSPGEFRGKFVWAELNGLPKTVMWPVKVVELPLVYCQSDTAWLHLKNSAKIEEFPNNIHKWKSVAEKSLKRKPTSLKAFLDDIEWALRELEHTGGDTDTSTPAGDTSITDISTPAGDTAITDTLTPAGDTGITDTSTPAGDTGITDTSTPAGDTAITDISTPAGDTAITDTSTPAGDTAITDTSTPAGDTAITDTSTPAGDTAITDTLTPAGDTGITDTSTPAGDTAITETPTQAGDTYITDTSTPAGDTAITETPTQTGDTYITDTSTPAGDTAITDTSTPAGDTAITDTSTQAGVTAITDTSTPAGDTAITTSGATYDLPLKRKRFNISSDSDDSSYLEKKQLKLPAECVPVVISDSDNSSHSSLFPLLTAKKITLPKSEADNDSDSRDTEECYGRLVIRDIHHKDIYVSVVEKSKSLFSKGGKGKKSDRVYNSRHPCPYCKETKSNFSHHISAKKHENEEAVIEIKNAKVEKERKHLLSQLRLKAAHEHNLRVINKEKRGEVFLLRRSNADDSDDDDSDEDGDKGKTIDISKYGPCPYCLGWVQKISLRRHVSQCTSNPVIFTNRSLEVQSDMIVGKVTVEASKVLVNEVFPIMLGDSVTKVAQTDELIVNLGNQWMMRNRGNVIMRKYYTSTVMRLAAKLKTACQQLSQTNLDITDYLSPTHFETVLKAALACCHIDDVEDEELKAPSNAIKLGFDIKRMLSAKLSKAIMAGDNQLQKDATDFLKLMEIQWGLRVTKLARGILVERSYNKRNELPRPADVKRLFEYLQKEIRGLNLADTSFTNFRTAAILMLARLTLYNRRRCHEVQAMRLRSYADRKMGIDEVGAEIRGELTEFEHQLLIKQEVVVIRGKTGRGVPVIIPPDSVLPLEFLSSAEVRTQAGIPADNVYVFANKGVGVFRAYDAIREVTQSPEADLQMPELIRTSNMRKYMATMLQALNCTEVERQWVLNHLGHTLNVHKIHYQQTSDVLERVDVAKILLIQDMGLVSQYRGKSIQDIQIEDLFNDATTEAEVQVLPQKSPDVRELRNALGLIEKNNATTEAQVLPQESPDVREARKVLRLIEKNNEDFDVIPDQEEDVDDSDEEESVYERTRKKPKLSTRQRWTTEEVEELNNLFIEDFKTNTLPGQKRIECIIKKSKVNNGVIWKRKRDTIKKKLSNMIIKQKRERNGK